MIQVIGNDLFQWDLGRSVCYTPDEGLEINELHFAHQGDAKALVMEVVAEDGAYTAEIPNILLQSGKPVRVWAVCTAANTRHNVELRILPVRKREKPTDYVYTQAEVKNYDSLTERIEKLEQGDNGGVNTIVVSVTNEVADHKPAEIYSHVQHGGMAVLLYSDIIFGMTRATERHVEFSSATDENLIDCIKVNEDGSVERYEHFFVSHELFQREIEKAVRSVNNVTPDKNGNVDISNRLTVFSDAENIATSNAREIAEHIANGGDAIYVGGDNFVCPLAGCTPDYAIFEHSADDGLLHTYLIYNDGTFDYNEAPSNASLSTTLGGKITRPITAEVGQTIVVRAVDDKGAPTTWEAADFPSDDHINSLIDTKLGVIEHGSY